MYVFLHILRPNNRLNVPGLTHSLPLSLLLLASSSCIDTDKCCGLWSAIRPQKFALSCWEILRLGGGCTTNKSWPANHNYHEAQSLLPIEGERERERVGWKSLRRARWQFSSFS